MFMGRDSDGRRTEEICGNIANQASHRDSETGKLERNDAQAARSTGAFAFLLGCGEFFLQTWERVFFDKNAQNTQSRISVPLLQK